MMCHPVTLSHIEPAGGAFRAAIAGAPNDRHRQAAHTDGAEIFPRRVLQSSTSCALFARDPDGRRDELVHP
jgi:hypothetical protein